MPSRLFCLAAENPEKKSRLVSASIVSIATTEPGSVRPATAAGVFPNLNAMASTYNYLSREDRRHPKESELFARVAEQLQQRTKLDTLEARGTLSIALKVAGFLPRDVGLEELSRTPNTLLPGELRARGVTDASEVCAAIDLSLDELRPPAFREN